MTTHISLPVCEIITTGSELLLGQIQDTNSTFLAAELAGIGVDVRFRTSVGDSSEDMTMALNTALGRSDLVITTGGLGPTEDDLTREVVATVSGVPLVFKQELMDQIDAVFKRYGYRMPESNRKQAYIPEGAEAIENPVGTAPNTTIVPFLRAIAPAKLTGSRELEDAAIITPSPTGTKTFSGILPI